MGQLSFEWPQEPMVPVEAPVRARVIELMASAILAVSANREENMDEQART